MDTNLLPELCVYTWGANSYGQLGLGNVEDLSVPKLALNTLQTGAVRLLSGGGGHSAVVSEEGELLVCGQNHKGQLGLGHSSEVTTFQLCPLIGQRAAHVSCGWDFTLVLTDRGQVLTCGSNAYGQLGVSEHVTHSAQLLTIKMLMEPVISVAAGLRHSLAVTGTGGVYQWGMGLSGQAKRALSPQPVPAHFTSKIPCLVPGLDQVMSHRVAAGSAHCVCLTAGGGVFMWGSNKHRQLTGTELFLPRPVLLDRSLLGGEKVKRIRSGWTHLVAQTESGRVFTWGRSNYGQLGRTESTNQSADQRSGGASTGAASQWARVPAEVKVLCGARQIACGSEHNVAIVGGRLLSWGWNEHGMCGDGSQTDVSQPQHIPALRPLLIGCGAGHSMALCAVRTGEEKSTEDMEIEQATLV
ncbi:secretion-regulating guanine nucleotide exchange factor [Coregonus clupeaformis]|uniref:secretion-regulating guanine nucleotide exchange factor n=1 Tax=Coregonus clupeaformis TaxID=59861 RepID=UPI001BE020A6|nr:secretion-regulating guanine nucleotide exchange factor [Coregonus clupeaformis]